jgi:Trypsin-like peptidase domain
MRTILPLALPPLLALVLATVGTGQQPGTVKDTLKEVKGRDILNELKLREAAAIKLRADAKDWSKGLTLDSFKRNMYAAATKETIERDVKASKMTNIATPALFAELNRRAVEKGIFGNDDRKDLFTLEAERAELAAVSGDTSYHDKALKNAAAVCCLVQASKLIPNGDESVKLKTIPFAESQHDTIKMCPLERFSTQPCGAFCTGFLVAPDVVVTAGHCVNADSVETTRFVFGFRMTSATQAVTTFPKGSVYSGKALLGHKLVNSTGEDWAVVKLDRPVADVTPVKFRKTEKIGNSDKVYVIGFPTGLPCKVAANAKVNQNGNEFVFTGNLDTYGGNSGSPVFNLTTHEVEGILVRGGQDFEFVTDTLGGCIKSVVLADSDGNEACTRATVFAASVPN